MIYFITKAKKTYTFLSFLNTWGNDLREKTAILPIEKFVRLKKFKPGTYILTDYDILSESQTKLLKTIYKELSTHSQSFNLLNNPVNSLNRIELLNKLYREELNVFRCFTANQIPEKIKFPVFVRKGRDHYGKISNLISNKTELKETVSEIKEEGFNESDILITEFVDTSDEKGIFRKYSAFLVADKIVPRHIFFSKKWMIKGADFIADNLLKEEVEYVKNNPHEKQLKAIFGISGMQYGRIDYSIQNGKIVTWEINPNPMIASSSSLKKSKRKIVHDLFSTQFIAAFSQLEIKTGNKSIENPIYKSALKSEIKTSFPFYSFLYFVSNLFQNMKSILLFNFYLIRNRFIK